MSSTFVAYARTNTTGGTAEHVTEKESEKNKAFFLIWIRTGKCGRECRQGDAALGYRGTRGAKRPGEKFSAGQRTLGNVRRNLAKCPNIGSKWEGFSMGGFWLVVYGYWPCWIVLFSYYDPFGIRVCYIRLYL
jgi:hypothetical protein